jgi:hypothetical protein
VQRTTIDQKNYSNLNKLKKIESFWKPRMIKFVLVKKMFGNEMILMVFREKTKL